MSRRHRQRVALLLGALVTLGSAGALVVNALGANLAFFLTPTELLAAAPPAAQPLRLGGLVEAGSVERGGDGLTVRFRVTDGATSLPVIYHGLLPDLFREGRGVVAGGHLQGGLFRADEVLAKHDERYLPPELAKIPQGSGGGE